MPFYLSQLSKLLSITLPEFCVSCNKAQGLLCKTCEQSIQNQIEIFESEHIQKVITFFDFETSRAVAKLIKKLKYTFSKHTAKILVELIDKSDTFLLPHNMYLCPVPLHKSKFLKRGFNQSELICSELSKKLHMPIYNGLMRTRDTGTQTKLNKKERKQNMSNAFKIQDQMHVPPVICIVDDVYTTGATMNECAKVLTQNGAKHVIGLAIAKKNV